jgi:uncharacterized protein YjiK
MSLGMAAQSVKNLISTWNDEDMSFGEKMLSTLTSIGMIMPTLINLGKTANILGKQTITIKDKENTEYLKGNGYKVVSETVTGKETAAVMENTTA